MTQVYYIELYTGKGSTNNNPPPAGQTCKLNLVYRRPQNDMSDISLVDSDMVK